MDVSSKYQVGKKFLAATVLLFSVNTLSTVSQARTLEEVKSKILTVAESYKGQGDQDHSKQDQLDVLVKELVDMTPKVAAADRLKLLAGGWKQVFGPYAFDDTRGVDPALDPEHIYQVISPRGYYYNVGRNHFLGGSITAVIRGVYDVSGEDSLRVHFTSVRFLFGSKKTDVDYVNLAELAETGKLKAIRLPSFLTGGILNQRGTLREVYTDGDTRILYGSSDNDFLRNHIYIMRKVQ